jgi:hypothetical protein
LCQRYYEKSYSIDVNPGTDTYNGLIITEGRNEVYQNLDNIQFRVSKRDTPTTTVYSRTGAAGNIYDHSGATNRPATIGGGESGAYVTMNNSAVPVGNDIHYHWTADAEL